MLQNPLQNRPNPLLQSTSRIKKCGALIGGVATKFLSMGKISRLAVGIIQADGNLEVHRVFGQNAGLVVEVRGTLKDV